jgi:prepilin-type N-terminal cleavage/methylation domain-containing protein
MKRRGFTLIELLMVIIVLATLVIIAIPAFAKTKYRAEKNQAITYLRAIRAAEKLYWTNGLNSGNTKTYVALANTSAINTTLGLEVKLTNWTFAVTSGSSTTFTVTATSDAASGSQTLTLDQAGTWGGTYAPLPTS